MPNRVVHPPQAPAFRPTESGATVLLEGLVRQILSKLTMVCWLIYRTSSSSPPQSPSETSSPPSAMSSRFKLLTRLTRPYRPSSASSTLHQLLYWLNQTACLWATRSSRSAYSPTLATPTSLRIKTDFSATDSPTARAPQPTRIHSLSASITSVLIKFPLLPPSNPRCSLSSRTSIPTQRRPSIHSHFQPTSPPLPRNPFRSGAAHSTFPCLTCVVPSLPTKT